MDLPCVEQCRALSKIKWLSVLECAHVGIFRVGVCVHFENFWVEEFEKKIFLLPWIWDKENHVWCFAWTRKKKSLNAYVVLHFELPYAEVVSRKAENFEKNEVFIVMHSSSLKFQGKLSTWSMELEIRTMYLQREVTPSIRFTQNKIQISTASNYLNMHAPQVYIRPYKRTLTTNEYSIYYHYRCFYRFH